MTSSSNFLKNLAKSNQPYSKFGNQTVVKKGVRFDSKLESSFDDFILAHPQLKLIERQVKIKLLDSQDHPLTGEKIRAIYYIADFLIKFDDSFLLVDSKGFETADFVIKHKLMIDKYRLGECPMLIVAKTTKELVGQLELTPKLKADVGADRGV